MTSAYICDAQRTPIGKFAGALSNVRCDDLAALPVSALIERNPTVDWSNFDDVVTAASIKPAKITEMWPAWRRC